VERQWLARAGWLSDLLAWLATTVPAIAHPHVWGKARAEIVFDLAARVTGIRHTWIFDPAFAAYTTMGLDAGGDGSPERLGALAQ
jgi:ABC-type uncharacterized transport system substrate-binding protein